MKKVVFFLIAATAIVMAGGDIAPVPEMVPDTPATGGGCTYNPNGTGVDMMFVLMMLTAAVYPLRNKLFGEK